MSLTLKSRDWLASIFKRYPNKRSLLKGTEGSVPGQRPGTAPLSLLRRHSWFHICSSLQNEARGESRGQFCADREKPGPQDPPPPRTWKQKQKNFGVPGAAFQSSQCASPGTGLGNCWGHSGCCKREDGEVQNRLYCVTVVVELWNIQVGKERAARRFQITNTFHSKLPSILRGWKWTESGLICPQVPVY